jgi:hypothetical protein
VDGIHDSGKVSWRVEYRRPWKLLSLSAGIAVMVVGSFYHPAPDWDVGISFIMPILAYLLAPWTVRVFVERRWRLWPAALLATWFTVDGVYALYWHFRDPVALAQMREANFLASLPLYGLCGLGWYYPGSLAELVAALRSAVRQFNGSPP